MPFLLALCCLLGGHVAASGGAPIAGAHIEVRGPQTRAARSDAAGNFHLQVAPGRYELRAWATGFSPTAAGPFAVDRPEHVAVTMQPLDTPELRVIGSVRVDGKLALQRDAVPNAIITRSDLDALGFSRVVEGLAELPSVTFARPDGGSDTAPTLVALRGPDPSETLIALDGQILNDANTGDLDLSRFPVAAFSSLSVTEGLGPSDTEGSNTIGGAVNIISLQPTRHAHTGFSVSGGSFGRSEVWYNWAMPAPSTIKTNTATSTKTSS
jgi:outer membrane receptor protein involved in Fe transport